ncbi:MAG: FHA domain-containing protein [Deltaproteobacteria bacterium]|nr:FHA domain-containing protein [Deltaproteobacteria bacterium]
MSQLWVRYEGTRFPVRQGETVVGRSAYCTIVIADPSVSREHVALRLTGDTFVVVDLGSRNGTFVNGERIEGERKLAVGDVILVGKAALEVIRTSYESSFEPGRRRVSTQDIVVDDPTTESVVTLRLVEKLVARAQQGDRSPEIVALITNAIDSAVARYRRGVPLADAEKLLAAADFLVSWTPDGSLDEWRAELRRKIVTRS